MENKKKNPWKGLQSYQDGEVLYGRDDDIRRLTQSVLNDRDTLLYGKSGIGKSSILNAGVLPAARRNGFSPIIIRLSHKAEESSYIAQIKQNIAQHGISTREVVPCQNAMEESIYEYFHRHTFHKSDNDTECAKLLIIFDQFEEIFTLQQDEQKKRNFFVELGNQLNGVMPEELLHDDTDEKVEKKTVLDLSNDDSFDDIFGDDDKKDNKQLQEYIDDNEIHLVFTIREDFLSEFEYYTSSIPSLKQNRYGLRPINEEQAAQIIMRPQPGLIDVDVARLIIEKVTDRTDFQLDGTPEIEVDSAVLSLYLNRLYDAKTSDIITKELVEEKGGEIISAFYYDAISSVSEASVEYLENMLLNGQGRRDNITVFDAINDGKVTEAELEILYEKKKVLRRFNYAGDLRIEFVHDILCPVVKQHKDERALRKQQEAERMRQEEELRIQEEEKQRFIKQEKRKRRNMVLAFSGILALILFGLSVWTYRYFMYRIEVKHYYTDFTRENGWPVGVGDELSKTEAEKRNCYYVLTRRGYSDYNPYFKVEITPNDNLAPTGLRTPLVGAEETDSDAKDFAEKLSRTRSIEFSGSKEVTKETAYDSNGNILFVTNFYYTSGSDGVTEDAFFWATYNDANGSPMKVRHQADRMKVFLDSLGHEKKYLFYDASGAPQANDLSFYGFSVTYDSLLRKTEILHLDAFGMPEVYERCAFPDDSTEVKSFFDANGNAITHPSLGFHKLELIHNGRGLLTETRMYISPDELMPDSLMPAYIRTAYYPHGLKKEVTMWNRDNKPYSGSEGCATTTWNYFSNSNKVCMEKRQDASGNMLYLYENKVNGNVADSIIDDRLNNTFLHQRTIRQKDQTKVMYLGRNGEKVFNNEEQCHSYVITTTKGKNGTTVVTKKFYDENNNLYYRPAMSAEENPAPAIEEKTYNSDGQMTRFISWDDKGNRVQSMGFDYIDGMESARYALGVHNEPIRCPQWEADGLCYYKLHSVRDFTGELAKIYAVGETGMESLIYFHDIGMEACDDNGDKVDLGSGWSYVTTKKPENYRPQASDVKLQYIHLTRLNGKADEIGLRDGDILIGSLQSWDAAWRNGGNITVRRWDEKTGRGKSMTFAVKACAKQDICAEVYGVYYSQKEYRKLMEN